MLGYFLARLLHAGFPAQGLLPHHPCPAADGGADRGRRDLAAPDRARASGRSPTISTSWFGIDFRIGSFADQAFLTTVVMDIWHWTPLVTLTLLAALSSMPKEPFEQAQIDGANRFQVFWHITLPMLRPAILATVFIRMMDALRTVDEVWMLTGGGPGAATRYIGLYIWRVVFPKTDYGYGSAMSLLTLYLTIVMCWLLYVALVARRGQQRAE